MSRIFKKGFTEFYENYKEEKVIYSTYMWRITKKWMTKEDAILPVNYLNQKEVKKFQEVLKINEDDLKYLEKLN